MAELNKDDVQAMIKEAVGETAAEMRQASQDFIKDIEERFGSVEVAKAQGIETNFAQAEGIAPKPKAEKSGALMGRMARALAAAKVDNSVQGAKAIEFIKDKAHREGDFQLRDACERSMAVREKALVLSEFAGAGALVPEDVANEVIPFIYANLVLEKLGATRVSMPNGNLTMPFSDTSVTASYVGEIQNIPVSEPTFGQLQMTAKKLGVVVPISNDFLRTPSASVDTLVQNDIVNSLSRRAELALLRGEGANGVPKGIRQWILDDATRSTASAGSSLANKVADLTGLVERVEDRDIPMLNPGFCMNVVTAWGLASTLDADGNFVFRDEMAAGMIMGYPFAKTTQMPKNLGGGSDESEIIFAAWGHFLIGETDSLELKVSPDAAYHDGSQVQAGFSQDVTPIRAIMRHDCAERYRGQSGELLTGVQY